MESRSNKFRLRLNLFDGIVLLLALAVGAVLLWSAVRPSAAPVESGSAADTVRYTIQFQRCLEGTVNAIHEGDRLTDSIRNYELGRVVSATAAPARALRVDNLSRSYILTTMEGFEDIDVVVEAPCVITQDAVTVGGGYPVRAGASAFIQGDGYLATGYIIAVERGDQ